MPTIHLGTLLDVNICQVQGQAQVHLRQAQDQWEEDGQGDSQEEVHQERQGLGVNLPYLSQ